LRILVDDVRAVDGIKNTLSRLPPGRGKVMLAVEMDALREVEIALPKTFQIDSAGRAAIKSLHGVVEVLEL